MQEKFKVLQERVGSWPTCRPISWLQKILLF